VRASSLARSLEGTLAAALPAPVREALRIIDSRHSEIALNATEIARGAGVSAAHLSRLFRRHLGRAPLAYLHDIRIARASWLLVHTELAIKEVAAACGYGTVKQLDRHFLARCGSLPMAYRHAARRA
jgi:transcriptional regulator GlxA family with amidase domain